MAVGGSRGERAPPWWRRRRRRIENVPIKRQASTRAGGVNSGMRPRGILGQAGPLMLGRGGATLLGFALPLILTRLLPQAEFGTYKQVWLVVTTACFMLQLGLSQSLYYFIPRKDGRQQEWLTQASMSLVVLGGACAAILYSSRSVLAHQFANPELAGFALPMALITWLMIAAAPLEISLTAEGRVRTAA